jgi:hypothetical protein
MVSVIQKLKSNTQILLPDEIEKRISELESENEEYNLEYLDKDLEFAFLVIADIFEKYEERTKADEDMLIPKSNNDETAVSLIKKKDDKILRLKEELKRMKGLFDECTQTIYEAIKATAPNFVDEDLFMNLGIVNDDSSLNSSMLTANNNSEREFIHKAVEMFKAYNNEVNEANKAYEKQLADSEANARRLKALADEYKNNLDALLSGNKENVKTESNNNTRSPKQFIVDVNKGRSFTVEDLLAESDNNNEVGVEKLNETEDYILDYAFVQKTPERYKVVQEAIFRDFKWFLVVSKHLDNNIYDARNVSWVPQDSLLGVDIDKEIEPNEEQFNEEDVTELINRNFDLEKEIKEKNTEIKGYKDTIDKLLKVNTEPVTNKTSKTIPIEKYEMILKDLHEEQLRSDELEKQYEELKKTFEGYKNTVTELQKKAVNKSFNHKEFVNKDLDQIDVHDLLEAHNKNAYDKLEKTNKTVDTIHMKKGGLGLINPLESSYHQNYTFNDSPRVKTNHSGTSLVRISLNLATC